MKRLFAAIAAAAALPLLAAESPETLRVLNWEGYFAPDTLSNFEKETGCRVELDYIVSIEMLRSKLERVPSGYDVVFPGDEALPQLAAGGLLETLDKSRLPNLKNISPKFLGLPFDPENDHSVPYMWGTTGIAYRKGAVEPPPDSWAALWDPRVARKMTFLEDPREVFCAAMRLNGDDPANPTIEAVERAKTRLLEARPLAYNSFPVDPFVANDIVIAQAFSGDALQAADQTKGEVIYVVPKEGGTQWLDNMAISKGTPHPDLAHRFIDYILRPEVNAAITVAKRYPSPNEAAKARLPKEVLEDPRIYPPEEVLKRCAFLKPMAPEIRKAVNDAWAGVRGK